MKNLKNRNLHPKTNHIPLQNTVASEIAVVVLVRSVASEVAAKVVVEVLVAAAAAAKSEAGEVEAGAVGGEIKIESVIESVRTENENAKSGNENVRERGRRSGKKRRSDVSAIESVKTRIEGSGGTRGDPGLGPNREGARTQRTKIRKKEVKRKRNWPRLERRHHRKLLRIRPPSKSTSGAWRRS